MTELKWHRVGHERPPTYEPVFVAQCVWTDDDGITHSCRNPFVAWYQLPTTTMPATWLRVDKDYSLVVNPTDVWMECDYD